MRAVSPLTSAANAAAIVLMRKQGGRVGEEEIARAGRMAAADTDVGHRGLEGKY